MNIREVVEPEVYANLMQSLAYLSLDAKNSNSSENVQDVLIEQVLNPLMDNLEENPQKTVEDHLQTIADLSAIVGLITFFLLSADPKTQTEYYAQFEAATTTSGHLDSIETAGEEDQTN